MDTQDTRGQWVIVHCSSGGYYRLTGVLLLNSKMDKRTLKKGKLFKIRAIYPKKAKVQKVSVNQVSVCPPRCGFEVLERVAKLHTVFVRRLLSLGLRHLGHICVLF